VEQSSAKNRRNLAETRNNLREKMNTTYNDIIGSYLRERFAPLRHATKIIARIGRVSPRTAENWLSGTHAPQGEALLNLIGECDDLGARIMAAAAERKGHH
jgi:hypothetical protein